MSPFVKDEHFCLHCNAYTLHACSYSEHERDSSSDMFICLTCEWVYHGCAGKHEPPPEQGWEGLLDDIEAEPEPDQCDMPVSFIAVIEALYDMDKAEGQWPESIYEGLSAAKWLIARFLPDAKQTTKDELVQAWKDALRGEGVI